MNGNECCAQMLTAYPVMALGGDSHNKSIPAPTSADIRMLAEGFHYLHGEYDSDQLRLMHQTRAGFSVVRYINSHIARAADIEGTPGRRLSVIYYVTGWLVEGITQAQTELTVLLDAKYSPLVASTAAGNVSTSTTFVTFVRMGNELMKITAVKQPGIIELGKPNGTKQIVSVERGFDGTVAVEHAKNESVFSPSYKNFPGQKWRDIVEAGDGDWQSIPALVKDLVENYGVEALDDADNPESPITYDIDPGSKYAHEMLSEFTIAAVQMGYNGSWFDCFSEGVLKAADVRGKHLPGFPFWNFANNSVYTKAAFLEAQRKRLQTVYNATRSALGYYPDLLANNVAGFYFDGGKSFMEAEAGFQPLKAYDHEAFAGVLTPIKPTANTCKGPPDEYEVTYRTGDKWVANVQQIMDASQSDLPLIAMMASAGCQSFPMEGLGERRTKLERFAYASYLIGAEGPTTRTMFGVPAYYQVRISSSIRLLIKRDHLHRSAKVILNKTGTWNVILSFKAISFGERLQTHATLCPVTPLFWKCMMVPILHVLAFPKLLGLILFHVYSRRQA